MVKTTKTISAPDAREAPTEQGRAIFLGEYDAWHSVHFFRAAPRGFDLCIPEYMGTADHRRGWCDRGCRRVVAAERQRRARASFVHDGPGLVGNANQWRLQKWRNRLGALARRVSDFDHLDGSAGFEDRQHHRLRGKTHLRGDRRTEIPI